jgi:serine/threonine-protein kinase
MPVAIKILDARAAEDRALAGRFEREARATASLSSPHVVSVLDRGALPEGGSYLVMELVPGCDLAKLLMEGGLLGLDRTLSVLRQIALAIDHAHERGIVHRDLKPENVMIDASPDEDFVKVLDFGVARDLHAPGTYTDYGEVVGTPEYMAPEQALGIHERIGPASDRYALAAIALEMLTGDLPYPSAPVARTLRMIAEAPPRRPSELGLELPGLDAIFDRAMARRPSHRYPTARAFVEALAERLRGVELPVTPVSAPRPPARAARTDSTAPTMPSAVPRSPLVLDLGHPSGEGLLAAKLPEHELGAARLATALVLAGLALAASAFAAGWMACLAALG